MPEFPPNRTAGQTVPAPRECERVNERLSSPACYANEADDVCMGYFNLSDTRSCPITA